MTLIRQSIQLENWLKEASQSYNSLVDKQYFQLIADWKANFWPFVENRQRAPYGDKARQKFENRLPINGYLFSGIKVDSAANMGGYYPQAYRMQGLTAIDWELCTANELIIVDKRFSYTIVCSHEGGSETYYENQ